MIQSKKTVVTILLILISFICTAQIPPPPQAPPGPVGLPIDNGLFALLVAGVLFGIYKIYKLKIKGNLVS